MFSVDNVVSRRCWKGRAHDFVLYVQNDSGDQMYQYK